jgi:hypothetical protein
VTKLSDRGSIESVGADVGFWISAMRY